MHAAFVLLAFLHLASCGDSDDIISDMQRSIRNMQKDISSLTDHIKQEDAKIETRLTELEKHVYNSDLMLEIVMKDTLRFSDEVHGMKAILTGAEKKVASVGKKVDEVNHIVIAVAKKVSDATNETKKEVASVESKVDKVNHIMVEVAKNVSDEIKETKKEVASVDSKVDKVNHSMMEVTKNVSDAMKENFQKIKDMKKEHSKDISKIAKTYIDLNGAVAILKTLDHMYNEFITKYKSKWAINFTDVIRLSRKHDYQVNGSVTILKTLDHMYNEFITTYKSKWGINFTDFVTLATDIDTGIKEIDELFTGFEDLWGIGSFKGFVDVVKKRDEKTKSDIMTSIGRIKQKEILKFVPTPSGSTTVPTNFGYQERDGKFFATGYVKMYYERKWCPIYYFYFTVNGFPPYYNFGNKEANVTCRTGGYATGTFIGSKRIPHLPSQLWIEKLKCIGNELTINERTKCETKNYDHWRSSVEVKCYL